MMNFAVWVFCLAIFAIPAMPAFAQNLVEADVLTAMVVGKGAPERPGEPWIFLLSSGQVIRVPAHDRARLEIFSRAETGKTYLEIKTTSNGDRLESVTDVGMEPFSRGSFDPQALMRVDFVFSEFPLNPKGIYDYFKSFQLRVGSQCFHRAHYWTHQLWLQTGVLSHKIFMFFTWNYIRRYSSKWWFHVAPFVFDERGKEVVLDATYLREPVTVKRWTDNFLTNDPECPVVPNYVGHSAHATREWCFVVKAPMWLYHPNVIEESNRKSSRVRKWHLEELAHARSSR